MEREKITILPNRNPAKRIRFGEEARHQPPGLPDESSLFVRREPGGSSGIGNRPLVLCAKTQPSEAGVFWRGRFAGN